MTAEDNLRALLISLLSEETERDQQRLVGASNISNPCTACLAWDMYVMLNPDVEPAPRGRYYMGAVIGTAIHALLEERAKKRALLRPETKVVIGEIPGYGVIKSTSDLYNEATQEVDDWKTTTRDKLKVYRLVPRTEVSEFDTEQMTKARLTIKQYFTQANLYGLGVENAGLPVQTVGIGFIARDAKTEEDVWAYTQPYDRAQAEHALDRATRIWQAMEQGRKPEEFKSHDLCYRCSLRRTEVL